MNTDLVLQLALQGFLMGGVYGLIALGLSLIFGVMRVINFAHGEMMVFAMFLTITLLVSLGIDPYLSLPITAAVMFGIGYVVQRIFVNRILDMPEASASFYKRHPGCRIQAAGQQMAPAMRHRPFRKGFPQDHHGQYPF